MTNGEKMKEIFPDFNLLSKNWWNTEYTGVSSSENQNRWIPVSERLPERDVDVLTYHRNESYDYQYVSWIDDYSGEWAGFIGSLSDEVLAWMPLPQPYKANKEREK